MRGRSGALTESAKLTASDRRLFDAFGHSVTVSGDTVVAGVSDKIGNNAVTVASAMRPTRRPRPANDEPVQSSFTTHQKRPVGKHQLAVDLARIE